MPSSTVTPGGAALACARLARMAVAGALVGHGLGACSSTAVGVDECRRIEEARCRASRGCGVRLDSNDAIEECVRFSADNCQHGLPTKDTPKAADMDKCVAAIETAGRCVQTEPLARNCTDLGMPSAGTTTVCEVVQSPELAPACSFLTGTPAQAGTGGSSGDAKGD